MTAIEKNLTIAACESALEYACENAGITSLAELETLVATLRSAFETDPASVTEYQILLVWVAFYLAQPPSLEDLSWIFKRLKKNRPTGKFDGTVKFEGSTLFNGGGIVS